MKTMTRFVMLACAAMALIPVASQADDARSEGYLVDVNGTIVTTTNTDLCWRDIEWTPSRSAEPCDPRNKPVAAAPAAKAIVIAAATAAPMARPAEVKPLPQKMSFSADALFAFNKSVLKPQGKTMLDELVRELDGGTYDVILVTGHADRIGSKEYNQKLSVRRANTVKDYLVSKDVPAGRIDAEGKGETQPVTHSGDCKGVKSAKVIACLQPDRRVDVEMNGTKTVASSR